MSSTSFRALVRPHLVSKYYCLEPWHRCVHTLSTRYVTVYTLHRFRLVGSIAGSAPVLTTKQKTCAHAGLPCPNSGAGAQMGVSILILREYHSWAACMGIKCESWSNCQLNCVVTMLGNGQGLIKHKGKKHVASKLFELLTGCKKTN